MELNRVQRAREEARKTAGILDPLIYAPFSALAAALTAPSGSRGRAGALGAVFGAGLSALAQKEYEARRNAGEEVASTDFVPLIRSILGGIATGGGFRVVQEQQERGRVSLRSAFLAGAPAGAAIGGDLVSAAVGTAVVPLLARLLPAAAQAQPSARIDDLAVRVRAAELAARMRQEEMLRVLRARNAAAIENPLTRWALPPPRVRHLGP